ncbi:MAG: TonB-dependent receptor [Caulobacteraceae bacterium]|nr:TonB-dependent receptor [Caulobacteraceae bacterium]
MKVCLGLGTALGVVLLYGSNSFAEAAPKPAADSTSVGEVVVTARGRAEQLLTVPISDTALSAKQLTDAHVREVSDFINLTPNITIVQAQNAGFSAITIRGITQVRNSESPVAVVVDGVQEVNSYQFTQQLFDLQSIEVLRGPQGALYGRDAEGGAILITTKQPTNALEGHVDLGGGSGGEFNAQGVVSGPLVKDQLYGRLGVSYVDRQGYFDNIYLHRKQDPFKDVAVQGLLKWVPTDKFSADLRGSYSVTDGGALNYHFQGAGLLPNGLINPADPVNFSIPGNANLVNDKFNSRDIGVDHRTIAEVSLKLTYDLGFATLSSITAWNHVEEFYSGDGYPYGNTTTLQLIPGTDLFDVDASATQYLDVDAKSEEVRLTSPNDQRFRWMVGGYYLYTDRYISTTTGFNKGLGILEVKRTPAGSGTINPTLSFLGDENHNTAYAGFVNFDYDLTRQLQLSAAFRYDEDQRTQYVSPYNTTGAPGAVNKATFGQGQPKFTVTYKALPTLSFYGSWGIGFRSGEFNQNGAAAAAAAAGTAGVADKVPQETAKTGEIGFKGSWFSNRLNVSGDIYQTDVSNQQYFVFIGAIAAQVLVPINQVQLRGGELEASAVLAPGLQVFGGLGVTDSTIKKYTVNPADVGKRAPYVPDMTFNAGVQYRTPITDSLVFVTRTDYRLLGKQYWDTENSTPRNPVNLVALSVGLEDAKGRWSASVKADNLFNARYNAEYVAGGYVEPANPAVVRGTIRVNF